jgi:cupin fold WbuC family metalloprotein
MALSTVDLNNPQSVRVDEKGRSIGFFCRRRPVRVDGNLIADLKAAAEKYGKNVRLCLHDSPDATFHEMIILERKGRYYRPHKHLEKGESYHILEGSMAAFVFDENGRLEDACVLKPDGNFIYRVDINMYHAVLPLADLVIYHESKPGPFLGDKDSIFPEWAPDGSDEDEVARYVDGLRKALERT